MTTNQPGREGGHPNSLGSHILIREINFACRRERIFRPILVADDDPFRAFGRCAALEEVFYGVVRVASAAESFIKLDEPAFAASVALGRQGETAEDYPDKNVRFLPDQASPADILNAATEMLSHARAA